MGGVLDEGSDPLRRARVRVRLQGVVAGRYRVQPSGVAPPDLAFRCLTLQLPRLGAMLRLSTLHSAGRRCTPPDRHCTCTAEIAPSPTRLRFRHSKPGYECQKRNLGLEGAMSNVNLQSRDGKCNLERAERCFGSRGLCDPRGHLRRLPGFGVAGAYENAAEKTAGGIFTMRGYQQLQMMQNMAKMKRNRRRDNRSGGSFLPFTDAVSPAARTGAAMFRFC